MSGGGGGGERVGGHADPLPLDELLHDDAAAVVRRLGRHRNGGEALGPEKLAIIMYSTSRTSKKLNDKPLRA